MRVRSVLAPALAMGVLLLWPAAPGAYTHHASLIRYVEHSPEAFERARREGKPVFLLISAVWCYWCKYFERNALETPEVADYLNRHYVSVFVDHDRRMDVARRHLRGLPMVVLFDPDGRVRQSFAGALRKEDFLSVLKRVEGEARAAPAAAPPAAPAAARPAPVPLTAETGRRLREGLLELLSAELDPVHGGFGIGDKHPHPRLLAYLLERHRATGDARYRTLVVTSLDGILRGIHDPVEGGFFRYAEGREWRQPHYEKLLHVNAGLAGVFDGAHRVTGDLRYRDAARSTAGYLLRVLYDREGGGFYGSQSADPEYYALSPDRRRQARRPPVNRDKVTAWNAEAALALLAMAEGGGGKDLAAAAHRTLEFMARRVVTDGGAFHLTEHRTGRGHLPGQLEANAWAALALLEGYRVSRAETYRRAAERVLAYATRELFDPGAGAFLEERRPEPGAPAPARYPLDGNGVMAEALLLAHRLTGRAEYRDTARRALESLGGEAPAVLLEGEEVPLVRVEGAVPYLRALERAVPGP
jgi:uncharacterized protein YyaL (SSP411 family)